MQRGFGMGKQHLILTAWLSRGGVQCRGSRLPRWCQIVYNIDVGGYRWDKMMPYRVTKAAAVTPTLSIEHLLYLCIHALIRACVPPYSFSRRCSWRGLCVDQWGVIQTRPNRCTTFTVWGVLVFVQDFQWFSIRLHLGWLWTLNSCLLRTLKLTEANISLSVF